MADEKNKPSAAEEAALKKAEVKAKKANNGKKVEKRKPGLYVCKGKSITCGKRVLDSGEPVDVKALKGGELGLKRLLVLGCIEEQK